jgi:acyl dehydratase
MTAVAMSPFGVGTILQGRSRTVTDAEIAFLPAIMGAISPLFHDEVAACESPMQGRILYGPALLGIAVALTEDQLRDHVIGLRGVDKVRFRKPVRVGDTITASFAVRSCSGRDRGLGLLLEVEDTVVNQTGEVVLTFERSIIIKDAELTP